MRQFVRKQILDLLSTLWKGVWQSKTLCPQAAESVLTDCYLAVQTVEQALQNGLSREKFANYTELLGSLKELLEEINAEISQGISVSDTTKKLKAELKQLRKMLSEEKEVKLEIVFFPYKASMWDSLESIWLAARNDENCDTYVVPIPYYDRLPNREFGTMHCEADLYPKDVPVVSWQAYDVEKRHPDIIFIHNPYDENNIVTSVHPDFYSKRIRACTDMLVYLPYFVVSGDVPEHYCTTAGCVYAHKTILQSESICNAYIRAFEMAFGNHFGDPKERFVPLGSPKFDKVINARRVDYTLPEELNDILSGKKVILYNTSIGAILQDSRQYLVKLQNVLSLFEKQNDVVLWWRPHPLLENTLNSMRPSLANAYREIVAKYRQNAYCFSKGANLDKNINKTLYIYDDTSDLDRAISISDGYFGDWSSLVALYASTGKPITIQDVNAICADTLEPRKLLFADFAFDNQGCAWAFELFCDGLFQIDFTNGHSEMVASSGRVPSCKGSLIDTHRYIDIFTKGPYVICFPFFLDDILLFNKESRDLTVIGLEQDYLEDISGYSGPVLVSVTEYAGNYYAFGTQIRAIVVFNPSDLSVCYHTCLLDKVGSYSQDRKNIRFPLYISEPSLEGDVNLILNDSTELLRYNLVTQEYDVLSSNSQTSGADLACYDGVRYWLFHSIKRVLFCWDTGDNIVYKYKLVCDGFQAENESVFSSIADCRNQILMFPSYSNMVVSFDKETHQFSRFAGLPDSDNDVPTYKYDPHKCVGDKIFAFARFRSTIYEINIGSGEITPHQFTYRKKDIWENINDLKLTISNTDPLYDGNAGKMIHEYIKSLILR